MSYVLSEKPNAEKLLSTSAVIFHRPKTKDRKIWIRTTVLIQVEAQ
jgi:hypothetical protein